jgi:hypothetical protein
MISIIFVQGLFNYIFSRRNNTFREIVVRISGYVSHFLSLRMRINEPGYAMLRKSVFKCRKWPERIVLVRFSKEFQSTGK